MRDVDHRLRLERFPGRRHQEGTARIAEYVDHLDDFRFRRVGQGAQVAQVGRTPHAARVCRLVGERLEQQFTNLLAPCAAQFRVGLLGVLIQR